MIDPSIISLILKWIVVRMITDKSILLVDSLLTHTIWILQDALYLVRLVIHDHNKDTREQNGGHVFQNKL